MVYIGQHPHIINIILLDSQNFLCLVEFRPHYNQPVFIINGYQMYLVYIEGDNDSNVFVQTYIQVILKPLWFCHMPTIQIKIPIRTKCIQLKNEDIFEEWEEV